MSRDDAKKEEPVVPVVTQPQTASLLDMSFDAPPPQAQAPPQQQQATFNPWGAPAQAAPVAAAPPTQPQWESFSGFYRFFTK